MKMLLQVGAIFLFLCGLYAYSAYYSKVTPYAEASSIGNNIQSFTDISNRFVTLAKDKGAVYAFEILKRAELPPNIDLHLLGHAVGEVLYEQKGTEGMAFCTQDFRNACSHTIVIGTLSDYGPSDQTIALIDKACHDAPGGTGAYTMCYHGLGHGVFAYFGYDLSKTVAFCKRMGTEEYKDEQYTQCVGGAIMELIDGGGHDHDKWQVAHDTYLTASDPLFPCDSDSIPEAAKTYCYMYLTPHLFELAGADLSHPDPSTFPKAFSFCDVLPKDSLDRQSCFGGFGKEFIPLAAGRDIRTVDQLSNEQYQTALNWCYLAGDDDGIVACVKQGLESVYWGGENDPAASVRFCGLVKDTYKNMCGEYLNKIQKLYIPK